jgi:hypothetical protein
MKRIWNIIVQSTAIVGQTVVPALPIDPEFMRLAHSAIAAIQGVAAVVAHNSNPDGTPSRTSYRPEDEKTIRFDQGDR